MPFSRRVIRQLRLIAKRFSEDNLGVYAAQAAFFITLSAVPLLMLLISLIRFALPVSYPELLNGLRKLTPESIHPLLTYLLGDVYQKSSAAILSLSTITMLWSASKCIYSLRLGLNNIHRSEKKRGYLYNRLSSMLYTLAMILIILFSLIILIFGNKLQALLNSHLPWLASVTGKIMGIRSIPAILILLVFFLLLYSLLPDERMSFKSQLPGAMFSTAGWLALSFGFSFYVDYFSGYSSMYGSLTAVILSMLWIYFCLYLILIGGELNIWLSEHPSFW